eukprot:5530835-Pyramimonas_sp.AAC.1
MSSAGSPSTNASGASSDDESNETRASRSGCPTSPVERDLAAVGGERAGDPVVGFGPIAVGADQL